MRIGKTVDGTRSVEKLQQRGTGKQGGNASKKFELEKDLAERVPWSISWKWK